MMYYNTKKQQLQMMQKYGMIIHKRVEHTTAGRLDRPEESPGFTESFIQAGMCDEVSVVIAPVADGSSKTPALFNAKDEWASDTPVAFELQSAEIKDGGSVWLRYLVKR